MTPPSDESVAAMWTAEAVSHFPEDCRVTGSCGRWIDKSTGELFVVLYEDVRRGLMHGYRVWRKPVVGRPTVEMWHCSGVATLLSYYQPEGVHTEAAS